MNMISICVCVCVCVCVCGSKIDCFNCCCISENNVVKENKYGKVLILIYLKVLTTA